MNKQQKIIRIAITNLSKIYKKSSGHQSLINFALNIGKKSRKDRRHNLEFFALKSINLTIYQGETIGIIGRNGSGKSTLLKIMAGIVTPSSGSIKVTGSVGAILEAGTGFHPELTGRENIYLRGAILGIQKEKIDKKLAEIIHFAGTDSFLDMPVKHYSSGMSMRLAFAIAVQLDPLILLIDEILSVGDENFRQKSFDKIREMARKNDRTVVIVSHNLQTVERLCTRTIFIEKGEIIQIGNSRDVIHNYFAHLQKNRAFEPKSITNKVFFNKKKLKKISNNHLLQQMRYMYTPLPLTPLGKWNIGSSPFGHLSLRYPLKLLWDEFEKRNLNSPAHIAWHQNITLALLPNHEISKVIYTQGAYEPNESYFFSRVLKSDMVFIDIGAHMGLYTLLAAKIIGKKGKVIAVEPSKREFSHLNKNIRLNNINNIISLKTAVFDSESKTTLQVAAAGAEGHNTLGAFVYKSTKKLRNETVKTTTVDSLVKNKNLSRVDVIKFDIEGAEYAALKGSQNTLKMFSPIIMFEASPHQITVFGHSVSHIRKFLNKYSYSTYRFNNRGFLKLSKSRNFSAGENIIAVRNSPKYKKIIRQVYSLFI